MNNINVKLDEANALISEKKFEKAKILLEEVVAEDSENVEAYKSLGLCNINLNKFAEAYVNFNAAIERAPDDALAWFYLGVIFETKNNLKEAESAFLKVIALREDYVDAYKNLFIVYLKQNEHKKIFEYQSKITEIAPDDYQIYYTIAIAHIGLSEYENAMANLEKAIELNPNHCALYNNLGSCFVALKRIDEAIPLFIKAIECDDKDSSGYHNLGVVYQIQMNHQLAYENFKKAYEFDSNAINLNALALAAFNAHQWKDAILYYNILICSNPEKQNYQYNLACAYQAVKEFQKAINILKNLVMLNPNSFPILERLANAYIESGNINEAKKIYETIILKGHVSPQIYYQYAVICAQTNDLDKAETILNKVIQLDPKNAIAHKDLGVIYLARRLFDYSKDELEFAYGLEPENPYIIFELANYWYVLSDYVKAQEYYDKLLTTNKLTDAMVLNIGMNYIALNKLDEAQELFQRALKLGLRTYDILFALGKVYFMKKQYETARQFIEDAYFIKQDIEISNLLALIYFELNEFAQSLSLFLLIDKASPNNINNMINIAKCKIELNEIDSAKEILNKVLDILPESKEAKFLIKRIK